MPVAPGTQVRVHGRWQTVASVSVGFFPPGSPSRERMYTLIDEYGVVSLLPATEVEG